MKDLINEIKRASPELQRELLINLINALLVDEPEQEKKTPYTSRGDS